MIASFVEALAKVGIEVDWRELADILWLSQLRHTINDEVLADHLPAEEPAAVAISVPKQTLREISGVVGKVSNISSKTASSDTDFPSSGLDMMKPGRQDPSAKLEVGRALRPFKRMRPSAIRRVFDIDATVEHYCATTVMAPMTAPAREKWFREVALVIDSGTTMAVWREEIALFTKLLERHGAFSRVTRWTLVKHGNEVNLKDRGGREHKPDILMQFNSRRIILVISDCIDDMWYESSVWAALRHWGTAGPVAILQTLPVRLWPATAVGEADVIMTSDIRGAVNQQLRLRSPWWWNDVSAPEQATPVIPFDEHRLGTWAQTVMGAGGLEVAGIVTRPPIAPQADSGTAPINAHTRVARFRAIVSEEAAHLATLLSAVEISLSIARSILYSLIHNPRETYLAEVLIGGLLQPSSPAAGFPDEESYDFISGVREVLQDALTTRAAIEVWRSVAPYLEAETGQRPPFSTLLSSSTPAPPSVAASSLGRIATDLVSRLGMTDLRPRVTTDISPPVPASGGSRPSRHSRIRRSAGSVAVLELSTYTQSAVSRQRMETTGPDRDEGFEDPIETVIPIALSYRIQSSVKDLSPEMYDVRIREAVGRSTILLGGPS